MLSNRCTHYYTYVRCRRSRYRLFDDRWPLWSAGGRWVKNTVITGGKRARSPFVFSLLQPCYLGLYIDHIILVYYSIL